MSIQRLTLWTLVGLLSLPVWSLPVDWNGVFGVDSNLIDNFRRIDRINETNPLNAGSQEVPLGPGDQANASFQTYVFRLNPTIIVNDAATFKAEITSGYGRGGFIGDNQSTSLEPGFGNALFGQNLSGGNDDRDDLSLNKFYVELYSDIATYVIGRHSAHWGLGAAINGGDNTWDRFTFVRDGITVNLKLGNFLFSPFWTKVSSGGSLTRADDLKEYGASLLYDNAETDLAFGVYFSKKKNNTFNSTIVSSASSTDLNGDGNTNDPVGRADVTLIDIYLKKSFGDLNLALEVPLYSGDIGFLTNNTNQTSYSARAIIFEGDYKINDTWKVGANFGSVSGDGGGLGSFDAAFLNPNYQVANLLFRYNLRAISGDVTANVFDSYITNAFYYKAFVEWQPLEKWTFNAAVIRALAQETANGGSSAFNHQTNTFFNANLTQSDDLGIEVDFGFNYQWNKEVSIGADFGYLLTGDYFAFTNDANVVNQAEASYIAQIRTAISF